MAVDLFLEKMALSAVLLVVTVLCSAAPWVLKSRFDGKKFTTVLKYLNSLAGGVVLGALLLHMIPELFHSSHHHHHSHSHKGPGPKSHSHKTHKHTHSEPTNEPSKFSLASIVTLNDHYPWGCFAAGIAFLFLFYIDRIFFGHDSDSEPSSTVDKKQEHQHHHHYHHSHSHQQHDCCNGHQGYGHDCKPIRDPKQMIIQITGIPNNGRTNNVEKSTAQSSSASTCHSHDLVGGCHMDSITKSTSQTQTMIFIFALSLHSFLEGLGAAGQSDINGLMQFAFGLVGHKFLEAFALGVSVMRAEFSTGRTIAVITTYSLLTPAGILAGIGALKMVSGHKIFAELLNGSAVGSFMFVGLIEMIPPEFHTYHRIHSPGKFAVLAAGFLLMAAVNAIGHEH